MAVYYIKDLLDRLYEIIKDGYEYVEVSDCREKSSLAVRALADENSAVEYEAIRSCPFGEGLESDSDEESCYALSFSYDEIATIASALSNAVSIYKKASDNNEFSAKEQEAFLAMLNKSSELKAKIEQAFR